MRAALRAQDWGLVRATIERMPSALAALPESSSLRRHRIGSLSSVFPSTTASAITTFMTGLPPSQHALTGWHVQLDEIDEMLAILPMTVRGRRQSPNEAAADAVD